MNRMKSINGMKRNLFIFLAILLLLIGITPTIAYANSAEPPALVIIMKNAPEDASVSLVTEDGLVEVGKTKTAWESYYVFYDNDIGTKSEITLKVSGNGTAYEQTIGSQYLGGYDSTITLDFVTKAITAGKLPVRSILLVSMRVLFTLIIESFVFFLFGFREKRSWIIFLVMNLLTQGFLNIALNAGSVLAIHSMFKLLIMEFWIFAVEIAGLLALIKEHSKLRRVTFVLVANILSLGLGLYLITTLPV